MSDREAQSREVAFNPYFCLGFFFTKLNLKIFELFRNSYLHFHAACYFSTPSIFHCICDVLMALPWWLSMPPCPLSSAHIGEDYSTGGWLITHEKALRWDCAWITSDKSEHHQQVARAGSVWMLLQYPLARDPEWYVCTRYGLSPRSHVCFLRCRRKWEMTKLVIVAEFL